MSASSPGELRIAIEHADSLAIVRISGEIDLATAPELRAVLDGVQYPGRTVAVDLSEVDFVDSTGLELFYFAHQRAKTVDAELVLVSIGDTPRRAFQIAGLDDVLTFAPDLASLGSGNGHARQNGATPEAE